MNQIPLIRNMGPPGRLAQLEERFPYKEEVGGSNPSTPTALRRGP